MKNVSTVLKVNFMRCIRVFYCLLIFIVSSQTLAAQEIVKGVDALGVLSNTDIFGYHRGLQDLKEIVPLSDTSRSINLYISTGYSVSSFYNEVLEPSGVSGASELFISIFYQISSTGAKAYIDVNLPETNNCSSDFKGLLSLCSLSEEEFSFSSINNETLSLHLDDFIDCFTPVVDAAYNCCSQSRGERRNSGCNSFTTHVEPEFKMPDNFCTRPSFESTTYFDPTGNLFSFGSLYTQVSGIIFSDGSGATPKGSVLSFFYRGKSYKSSTYEYDRTAFIGYCRAVGYQQINPNDKIELNYYGASSIGATISVLCAFSFDDKECAVTCGTLQYTVQSSNTNGSGINILNTISALPVRLSADNLYPFSRPPVMDAVTYTNVHNVSIPTPSPTIIDYLGIHIEDYTETTKLPCPPQTMLTGGQIRTAINSGTNMILDVRDYVSFYLLTNIGYLYFSTPHSIVSGTDIYEVYIYNPMTGNWKPFDTQGVQFLNLSTVANSVYIALKDEVFTVDNVQITIEVVGALGIPIVSDLADGLNGVIYLIRGDNGNAILSFAGAALPFVSAASRRLPNAFELALNARYSGKYAKIYGKNHEGVELFVDFDFTSARNINSFLTDIVASSDEVDDIAKLINRSKDFNFLLSNNPSAASAAVLLSRNGLLDLGTLASRNSDDFVRLERLSDDMMSSSGPSSFNAFLYSSPDAVRAWDFVRAATGSNSAKRLAVDILESVSKHLDDADFMTIIGNGNIQSGKNAFGELINKYAGKCQACTGGNPSQYLPDNPQEYIDEVVELTKRYSDKNGVDIFKEAKKGFTSQEGAWHAMQHLDGLDPSTVKRIDAKFEGEGLPCEGCRFDVELIPTTSKPLKLIEYKSYLDASNIPLQQFKNYLNDVTYLNQFNYIFSKSKLDLTGAQNGVKNFLNNKAVDLFKTPANGGIGLAKMKQLFEFDNFVFDNATEFNNLLTNNSSFRNNALSFVKTN